MRRKFGGGDGEHLLRTACPLNWPRAFYYPLDEHGQPLGVAPVAGRRPSKFIVPVPAARRRVAAAQDGVIAVKIINHFGDEVMKVYRV